MKRHLIALMFIAVPAPVLAQEPSPAVVATPAPADPAKLAVASRIAGALLPDGTYRTMMRGTFDKMMSSMVDQMGDLPLREILLAAGMQDKDVPMIQPGAMKEVMAIVDPVYRQRMDLGMKAMISSMTDMMSKYEPAQREGLAEAYARRFDATQLGKLERFFATPTGKQYAAQSMLIYADPAVMDRMMAMVPDMMKAMPKMIGTMTEATKDLPKQRRYADLSKDERTRLAALLGIDAKEMK